MDLQELIKRGRLLLAGSSKRFAVFRLVNGRRTAMDIALETRRQATNVHRDLKLLSDAELIRIRTRDGRAAKANGYVVYEKVPLARTLPLTYFHGQPASVKPAERSSRTKPKTERAKALPVPSSSEIVDICNRGEDQTYEFKSAGTEVRKITREVAAMLNTRQGGMIFYGVDDHGKIHGSGVSRQDFDQPLQNSVRNSINPSAVVGLKAVQALGSEILVVVVPPWNGSDVYMFEEKVLLRRSTNVFAAKPDELRKLFRGEAVV